MTDELSVQAVNDYQEKKGNYAVPGLVAGGAVGAAGGVAAAHYKNWGITQKPDLDKVFQQEADSFNGKIERSKGDVKTYYEAAKEEVQKFTNAGKEFNRIEAEAKKGGVANVSELPDGEIKTNLVNAQNAYDNEVKRLVKEREQSVSGSIANYDITNPKFKDSGAFSASELLADGTKDNYINRYQARIEYDKLTNDVIKASTDVRTMLDAAGQPSNLRKAALQPSSATGGVSSINDLFEYFNSEYLRATDDEKTKIFNKTKIQSGAEVTTEAYNQAYNLAKTLYNDPGALSNPSTQAEHYLKFGEFVEGAKPIAPIGGQVVPMSYVDASGHHTGWIKYTDTAKLEYEKQLKATVEAQRVATAEQFLAKASNYATLKQNAQTSELVKAIQTQFNGREYLDGLGRLNASTPLCDTTNWIRVSDIVNESKNNSYKTKIGEVEVTGYEHDINELKKANKKMPKKLNGVYLDAAGKTITDPKKALEIAERRHSIASAYRQLETSINRQIEECLTDNQYIKGLDEQIAKAFAEDKSLTEARMNLATRFKKIFTETEAGNNVDIEAEVRKALENTEIAKKLEEADKAAKEELARLGKTTGEVSAEELEKIMKEKLGAGTKDEYQKLVKEKASERLKTLAEKAKIANKTWTGVAAGAGLALIGALIGMSAKKDA